MKHRYSQRHTRLMNLLRARREELGMTQQELCRRLKRSTKFVSQIETGTVMLDALEFIEYAKALKMDPRELLGKLLK